jgi:hypothetical protein
MRCYARPKNAVSQIVTRKRRLSSGKIIGGIPFTKGPLAYLLKNRMYLGEINHGHVERAVLGALVNLVPNDVADGIPVAADCNSSRAGCANTGSSRDRDRDGSPHERGGGRNDAEDLRVIDEMVESVTVDQSGLAIILNPGAVAVDRSCRLLVPGSKPPNRVRHELLPPADGPRDDPRVIRAETRILLLRSEPVSRLTTGR